MSAKAPLMICCPNCQKRILWDKEQAFRPFCSERCKLIDLGEWASGERKISDETIYSELDNPLNDALQ